MKMYLVNDAISEDDIDDLMEKCWEAEEQGKNRYLGMSYEQGIKAALMWAFDLGYDQEHPLNE
jgi:hypothetical protein